MTINNILEKLNHKHRTEVEIDDGQFSLCGVDFVANYSSVWCDNDENSNAVYFAMAGTEAEDGTVYVTIEFPYVDGWDKLSKEEKEALIACGEQCDWTRAYARRSVIVFEA